MAEVRFWPATTTCPTTRSRESPRGPTGYNPPPPDPQQSAAGTRTAPTSGGSDYKTRRLLEDGRTYLIKNENATARSPKRLLSPWYSCAPPTRGGKPQKYLPAARCWSPVGDRYLVEARGVLGCLPHADVHPAIAWC